SRDALQSDWVRVETTILTWRHSQNPSIMLVPVLVGDVSPHDTGFDTFKPVQLQEIQFATIDSTTNLDADVHAFINKIVASFRHFTYHESDPLLRTWLEDVEVFLRKICTVHLKRAAEILKIDDWCEFQDDRSAIVAHQLLHTDLKTAYLALQELVKSLPTD